MHNQDVFSLCIDDMTASLELVAELEDELGDVLRKSDDLDPGRKSDPGYKHSYKSNNTSDNAGEAVAF